MKILERRVHQLEHVGPLIDENQQLREFVESLERMLAAAHADRERLRAKKAQLEEDNWQLMVQVGDMVDLENGEFCTQLVG